MTTTSRGKGILPPVLTSPQAMLEAELCPCTVYLFRAGELIFRVYGYELEQDDSGYTWEVEVGQPTTGYLTQVKGGSLAEAFLNAVFSMGLISYERFKSIVASQYSN